MQSISKDVSLFERFWAKVETGDGCWLWRAHCYKNGYGQFFDGQTQVRAHRLAYVLTYGGIPDGLFVLHRCDTPRCVRPSHLRLGTQAENLQDMTDKGRRHAGDNHWSRRHPEQSSSHLPILRGEANAQHKLTNEQVLEIYHRALVKGEKNNAIAGDYGVSSNVVSMIKRGKAWSWLTGAAGA